MRVNPLEYTLPGEYFLDMFQPIRYPEIVQTTDINAFSFISLNCTRFPEMQAIVEILTKKYMLKQIRYG